MCNLRHKSLSTCGSISVEQIPPSEVIWSKWTGMCDFDRYCQIPLRGRGPADTPTNNIRQLPIFPTSLPPQCAIELFICCQVIRHTLASNCSLNLHFSYSEKRRVSFHVFKSHLYFLFCDLVCVRCHVFFGVVFFLFLSRNILCLREINSSSVICRTNVFPVCHLPSLAPLKTTTTNIWSITYTAKCAVWWIVTKQATCVTFRLSLFISLELLPREAFYFHIIRFIDLLFCNF